MAISDTVVSNIVIFLITTPIMLFVGRRIAKKETKNTIYNGRIDVTINSIRDLSDQAVNYFTKTMDDRERIALSAIITSHMRRISADISDIVRNTGNIDDLYMKQYTCYYNAITNEPFGDRDIDVVSNNDPLIEGIRVAEEHLIIVMRSMISN